MTVSGDTRDGLYDADRVAALATANAKPTRANWLAVYNAAPVTDTHHVVYTETELVTTQPEHLDHTRFNYHGEGNLVKATFVRKDTEIPVTEWEFAQAAAKETTEGIFHKPTARLENSTYKGNKVVIASKRMEVTLEELDLDNGTVVAAIDDVSGTLTYVRQDLDEDGFVVESEVIKLGEFTKGGSFTMAKEREIVLDRFEKVNEDVDNTHIMYLGRTETSDGVRVHATTAEPVYAYDIDVLEVERMKRLENGGQITMKEVYAKRDENEFALFGIMDMNASYALIQNGHPAGDMTNIDQRLGVTDFTPPEQGHHEETATMNPSFGNESYKITFVQSDKDDKPYVAGSVTDTRGDAEYALDFCWSASVRGRTSRSRRICTKITK